MLTVMGRRLHVTGHFIARYGAVILLFWTGVMKFIPCDAEGIQPLIANSRVMSWDCGVASVSTFSIVVGVIEITIALLIALRPRCPKLSAIGSLLAAGMFLTTFSFLFVTPKLGGFPALAAVSWQVVLKDVVLLGAALSSAGEAWDAAKLHRRGEFLIPQGVVSCKSTNGVVN
jgi:uncharacterized membrane protein YkgB